MKTKSLEFLLIKLLRKLIKQELKKIQDEDLQNMAKNVNHPDDKLSEISEQQTISQITAIVNPIPNSESLDLAFSTEADAELERRLREFKFKQELRKDWILFLVKDVIVYATTVTFILIFSALFLFQILYPA